WLLERGMESVMAHDRALSARFLSGIAQLPQVTLFGPTDPAARVAVFSIRVAGIEPAEMTTILDHEFGILTRSGLHCAPLAHETIGTRADGGTTRISFGAFTTMDEVDRCVDALRAITEAS